MKEILHFKIRADFKEHIYGNPIKTEDMKIYLIVGNVYQKQFQFKQRIQRKWARQYKIIYKMQLLTDHFYSLRVLFSKLSMDMNVYILMATDVFFQIPLSQSKHLPNLSSKDIY